MESLPRQPQRRRFEQIPTVIILLKFPAVQLHGQAWCLVIERNNVTPDRPRHHRVLITRADTQPRRTYVRVNIRLFNSPHSLANFDTYFSIFVSAYHVQPRGSCPLPAMEVHTRHPRQRRELRGNPDLFRLFGLAWLAGRGILPGGRRVAEEGGGEAAEEGGGAAVGLDDKDRGRRVVGVLTLPSPFVMLVVVATTRKGLGVGWGGPCSSKSSSPPSSSSSS